jgi:predicted DNA-binding transcriptional regulator AlpA
VEPYTVHVEIRRQAADDHWAVTEDAITALVDRLADHGGSVSGGPGYDSWGATVSIEFSPTEFFAPRGAALAATIATDLIQDLGMEVGLPRGDVVRAEAVRADVADEDLERPPFPEVVTAPEVAEILGITRQRVHTLAAQNKDFPPAIRVGSVRCWYRAAIEQFKDEWTRQGGWPKGRSRKAS